MKLKNLSLTAKSKYSPMRKIGLATWGFPGDPSVYGTISLRAEKVLNYMAEYKKQHRKPITLLQVLVKISGHVLQEVPDANSLIRFRRIYRRKQIGVFVQVFLKDPITNELDLSGVTLLHPEKKTLAEIIDEFQVRIKKVREGEENEFKQTRELFRHLPFWITRPILKISALLNYTFNLNLSLFGIPSDAFGSIMITNIASLGLEQAFVPLVPYSRIPMLIALGPVVEEPVVEKGEIVVGKVVRLHTTFDHRLLDGSHGAAMARALKKCFADPEKYLGEISKT